MSELGRRLQNARKTAGLSAQKLADRLPDHLSRGVIANIESGRKPDVAVTDLIAICKALDVSVLALMPSLGFDVEREAYKLGYDQAIADMKSWSELKQGDR